MFRLCVIGDLLVSVPYCTNKKKSKRSKWALIPLLFWGSNWLRSLLFQQDVLCMWSNHLKQGPPLKDHVAFQTHRRHIYVSVYHHHKSYKVCVVITFRLSGAVYASISSQKSIVCIQCDQCRFLCLVEKRIGQWQQILAISCIDK